MTGLTKAAAFFDWLRNNDMLGPTLTKAEVDGCNAIVGALGPRGWGLGWVSYGLATAYHETAGTMQPIHEVGGADYFRRLYDVQGRDPERARSMGNVRPGDGALYHGRGYVQLTWCDNYARAGRELGLPLKDQPDLALRPDVAASIMALGMEEGWFTGKGLGKYIPKVATTATPMAYAAARYVINGNDKAARIAGYAGAFEKALVAGGWR